jgi:hypothetical protein
MLKQTSSGRRFQAGKVDPAPGLGLAILDVKLAIP